MTFLSTLAAFVVALGSLIVFHEFGHYAVARLCGVKVLRFSVGFGKPVWKRTLGKDATEWAVGAFPFGGYVKMLDEREAPVAAHELHRAFNRQSVWRRVAIVAAGPIANFILAVLLYWVLFVHGLPGIRPVVAAPPAASAAASARFEAGDAITQVGDEPVKTWQDLRWQLLKHAVRRDAVSIEVENLGGEPHTRRLDFAGLKADDLDADFLKAVGLERFQPPLQPIVGKVLPDSAAERAGLKEGDEVISAGGQDIRRWDEMVEVIRHHPEVPVALVVRRGSDELEISVTPASEPEGDLEVGKIGIGPRIDPGMLQRYVTEVSYGPVDATGQAIRKTWDATAFTFQMLWKMVAGEVSLKNLSGPITIADYAGQSAQMGWLAYLSFLALISISLGVLNLLPVPLLDGGHLMYYAVEIIKGSPVSERTLEMGQRVGMIVLFSLMAFAIYNDIHRLFGGS
ncbi:MAG: RIP metalloprotease RseP [Betaproteobacteria bacterium]